MHRRKPYPFVAEENVCNSLYYFGIKFPAHQSRAICDTQPTELWAFSSKFHHQECTGTSPWQMVFSVKALPTK